MAQLRYTGRPVCLMECSVKFRRFKRSVLFVALSLMLGACGTNPYSQPRIETPEPEYREPVPEPVPETQTETQPQVSRPPASGAHAALLAKADNARVQGEYDQALAYLERALRIDPDNAEIYLELAQTHAAAGNPTQARATAERGLLYCSGRSQCDALRSFTR